MDSLVQILTLFFVLFSLIVVMAVLVIFASSDEWEKYKVTLISLSTLWSGLLFATSFTNYLL